MCSSAWYPIKIIFMEGSDEDKHFWRKYITKAGGKVPAEVAKWENGRVRLMNRSEQPETGYYHCKRKRGRSLLIKVTNGYYSLGDKLLEGFDLWTDTEAKLQQL